MRETLFDFASKLLRRCEIVESLECEGWVEAPGGARGLSADRSGGR
jgi:hypothetical protein